MPSTSNSKGFHRDKYLNQQQQHHHQVDDDGATAELTHHHHEENDQELNFHESSSNQQHHHHQQDQHHHHHHHPHPYHHHEHQQQQQQQQHFYHRHHNLPSFNNIIGCGSRNRIHHSNNRHGAGGGGSAEDGLMISELLLKDSRSCHGILNSGQDDEMKITGYRRSSIRTTLCWIFVIVTFGLIRLVMHWWRHWFLLATHSPCPLDIAEKILISENYQGKHTQYYVKDVFTLNGETFKKIMETEEGKTKWKKYFPLNTDTSYIMDENEKQFYLSIHFISGNFKHMESIRFFQCKQIRYVWDVQSQMFQKLKGLDVEIPSSYLHQKKGLTQVEQMARRLIYGLNEITIPIRGVFTLLFLEVLNPFYVFQIFSVCLWISYEYYYYAVVIILMSAFGITMSILQTKKNQDALRNTVHNSDYALVVYDNGDVERIETQYLVPGDIIEIPSSGCTMQCDAVLLSGNCILDESMLTGESVPVTKTPLPMKRDLIFDKKEHSRHTLFSGTKVIQTRYIGSEKVLAIVINTGNITAKGGLIRSILYPPPVDYKFEQDSYKFIALLSVIAGFGFLYTLITKITRSIPAMKIVIESLDLITIAVPPALPAAMTVGRFYAQKRLETNSIYCISPRSINVSGSIDCVCFDKTGTLTEDGLDMWGVVPKSSTNQFQIPLKQIDRLPCDHFLFGMVTCHSITIMNGEMKGDPLDLKMFESTGWILEEANVADDNKYDLLFPTIVRQPSKKAINSTQSENSLFRNSGELTDNDEIDEAVVVKQQNDRGDMLNISDEDLATMNESSNDIGIVREFPFTSSLQRMSVITRRLGDNHFNVYCKGSPEMIQTLCKKESIPDTYMNQLDIYAQEGYRVISIAYKSLEMKMTYPKVQKISRDKIECDLEFQGFVVLENRLKPDTTEVIHNLMSANIRTIMVTGDNMLTALSVAKDCGMIRKKESVITVNARQHPTKPNEFELYYNLTGLGAGNVHSSSNKNHVPMICNNDNSITTSIPISLSGSLTKNDDSIHCYDIQQDNTITAGGTTTMLTTLQSISEFQQNQQQQQQQQQHQIGKSTNNGEVFSVMMGTNSNSVYSLETINTVTAIGTLPGAAAAAANNNSNNNNNNSKDVEFGLNERMTKKRNRTICDKLFGNCSNAITGRTRNSFNNRRGYNSDDNDDDDDDNDEDNIGQNRENNYVNRYNPSRRNYNIQFSNNLNNYRFAMVGKTWSIVKEHFPELLPKFVTRGTIFARMSPDQKQSLILELQDLGYYVAMCGDGANDCGALKAAHTGISLSEAESSVASPFTSKNPTIRCVPNVIKEGRAALVTSFGIFKYMAAYSLVQFVSVLILYSIDSNLTDIQFLYIDLFLISIFAFFFGKTEAYGGKLVKQPPLNSLISLSPILSLLLHLSVAIIFQLLALYQLQQQEWFKPFNFTAIANKDELGCYENYTIFIISCFQYILLAIVFSKGSPYRKSIISNYAFLISITINTIIVIYLTLGPFKSLEEGFELIMPPHYEFRIMLLIYGFANFLISLFIESFLIEYIVFKKLRYKWHNIEKSHRKYLLIEKQLNDDYQWPPLSFYQNDISSISIDDKSSPLSYAEIGAEHGVDLKEIDQNSVLNSFFDSSPLSPAAVPISLPPVMMKPDHHFPTEIQLPNNKNFNGDDENDDGVFTKETAVKSQNINNSNVAFNDDDDKKSTLSSLESLNKIEDSAGEKRNYNNLVEMPSPTLLKTTTTISPILSSLSSPSSSSSSSYKTSTNVDINSYNFCNGGDNDDDDVNTGSNVAIENPVIIDLPKGTQCVNNIDDEMMLNPLKLQTLPSSARLQQNITNEKSILNQNSNSRKDQSLPLPPTDSDDSSHHDKKNHSEMATLRMLQEPQHNNPNKNHYNEMKLNNMTTTFNTPSSSSFGSSSSSSSSSFSSCSPKKEINRNFNNKMMMNNKIGNNQLNHHSIIANENGLIIINNDDDDNNDLHDNVVIDSLKNTNNSIISNERKSINHNNRNNDAAGDENCSSVKLRNTKILDKTGNNSNISSSSSPTAAAIVAENAATTSSVFTSITTTTTPDPLRRRRVLDSGSVVVNNDNNYNNSKVNNINNYDYNNTNNNNSSNNNNSNNNNNNFNSTNNINKNMNNQQS